MEEPILNIDWDERKRRLVDLLEPIAIAYLYIASLLSPVFGLVIGIVAMKKCQLEKNKRVGKICLILGIVAIGLWSLCVVAYVLIIVAAMAAEKGGSPF